MKAVWLLICLGLGTAVSFAAGSPRKVSSPDVFLITIDTLRADHIHCYGDEHIQTPGLDSLANDGFRFAQAFTPSPITNTSHASILTGLLPSSHGVTDFAIPLAATHPTLAELLKKKGYRTAAFVGAVILDSKTLAPGFDRGFDFYDNFPQHSRSNLRWGRVERRGMDVVHRAESWLGAHPQGPHFVWVHLYDPHDPYEPPAPYSLTYRDRPYDGEVAYADSALANFVAYIKKQGWYENSVVIVVGDHGEGLGEHHEETHGIFLYDSTTHVPLIVKLPAGKTSSKIANEQVRTTDILPTVLDILRVPLPERLDGESLKPYFAGAENTRRTALGETDYPLRFGWAPLRSVRQEGFKFIEAPRPELYNLRSDPGELKNVYQPWDENVRKYREILTAVRAKATPAQPSAATVGQGTLDELKALGYLGPADAASSTNVPEPSLLPDPKDKIEEQNLLHNAMMASEDSRPNDARRSLEKVLQLDPKSPTALRQLGELELHAGEYGTAAEHLTRAREVSPGDATAALHEGQALVKAGNLAGARDALEASLKLMPGQLPARLLLGEVYLGLKNTPAAEDQFEAAQLLQPASMEVQLGLAKVKIAGGHFKDVVQQLEPLSKAQPNNAEIFELLAQAYRGLGKNQEAQKSEARVRLLRTIGPKH